MVAETVERFGGVDILVANAGTNIRKTPEGATRSTSGTDRRHQPDQRLRVLPGGLPEMQQRGGGKIVTIGSMASIFGFDVAAVYAATKGAVVQLTKPGLGVGQGQHPGQLHPARVGRHRPDPRRAARRLGPARTGHRAHPGTPLGRPRRTWPARRSSSVRPPATSSPVPRCPWTAASPARCSEPLAPPELSRRR